MSLGARQLVVAGLAANALRPLHGAAAIPSFVAGWLTGELAPQLLALTALDTATAVARGRARTRDLAVAAVAAGALGALVRTSWGASALSEQALEELGETYERPGRADLLTPWRQVARPFHLRRREVERIADVTYAQGGSRARLDVLRPRGGVENAPVLVQIHGGAWVLGNKEEQGQLLMNRMAAEGWVCVAPNYRLAPKHRWPTQIHDVRAVIAWVREHVAEYGGDPDYVVVTGGSAGGHLAALAALTADPPVAACVPFYGVYDLAGVTGLRSVRTMREGFLARWVFPADATDADYEDASPITHVRPDAPDFFVLHGAKDTVVSVRQARRFVERLRETSRQSVTYVELPGAQHAFEIFSSIRSQAAIGAVSRWLHWHETAHHA